jgi:1,4-dihydroxy-2-naphthoate polyprenyltransferase
MSTVTAPHLKQSLSISTWLLAARPKTLPAAVAPVLVGCAVAWAEGAFSPLPALAAFAVALLLQIGANLANDVADFRRGADTVDRLGPVRVTQSGLLSARQVAIATGVVLALAAVPGLYLVSRGGPLFALIGVLALLAAVAYTAGPKPYGYAGLGEIFVFLFFGPVAVTGTAYVMMQTLSSLAIAASIPLGCLVTAILVVNNLRDIETDRAAGKRTLAVRLGQGATRREYAVLLAVAYAAPLLIWFGGLTPPWPMLAWATAPLAMLLVRRVWTVSGRGLNPVLGGTARLCLWYAIAFGVGIAL